MRTRSSCVVFMILAFFILTLPFPAGAVVNWTNRSETNLGPGVSGTWDAYEIGAPNVIKDGSTYKMWYTGKNSTGPYQIGYATSSDGVNWTKDGANPIIRPADAGTWGGLPVQHIGKCAVIKNGSNYEMWYSATTGAPGEGKGQIGYATSLDGITWSHHGSPVLLPGPASDWDGGAVDGPAVIKDGSTYKMWYNGHGPSQPGIGYATSPNGINWTKWNNPNTGGSPYANSDPVIKLGPGRSWNGWGLGSPTVIKEDTKVHLWFRGNSGDPTDNRERIGYAYNVNSGDGFAWIIYPGNPLLHPGAPTAFDAGGVSDPTVIKDGNTYRMWYYGAGTGESGPRGKINYAESYAYQGNTLAFDKINLYARYELTRSGISVSIQGRFPSPLDITQCTVSGPNGFYISLGDSQLSSDGKNQKAQSIDLFSPITGGVTSAYSGTYTFTMKANNGLTITKSVDLDVSFMAAPDELSLDRYVNTTQGTNVYAGTVTPTLKWKPCLGDDKYYRVSVLDWSGNSAWYISDWVPGSSKGGGYLSVTIPTGYLKADTPYRWKVQIADRYPGNMFNSFNRADTSNPHYTFYTGTKGTGNFLSGVVFDRVQSYLEGGITTMAAAVANLAPWDIVTLRVENETYTSPYYYTFAPNAPYYNTTDAYTADHAPFSYLKLLNGPDIANTSSWGYKFFVSDGSNSSQLYAQYVTPPSGGARPNLTREQRAPHDNAYLQTLEPTLTWKSEGTAYTYRVMIIDWRNFHQPYKSGYLTGLEAGQDMSITVPAGVLQGSNPYRWFVDTFDSGKYNRIRTEMLSFMTPGNLAPHASPTGGGTYQINDTIFLGGQVSDFDGDQLSYTWLEGTTVLFSGTVQAVAGGTPYNLTPVNINILPLGTHTLTLKVNDGINPAVSSNITIEIIDTIAPTLAPAPDKTILWPANHKMVPITIFTNARDNSGKAVSFKASVASNEPQEGLGDGDTPSDWTNPIEKDGIITLQLRAERSGKGNGRIYTVTIIATDQSGNSSTAKVNITVPHDKGK